MGRELVAWSKKFEVGIEALDTQHGLLIDAINQIWHCIVFQAEQERVHDLLNRLETLFVAHFTREEAYMTAIDYPHFLAHKRMHRHFAKRLSDEKEAVLNGGGLTLSLLQFLKEWLLDHIQNADKAIADYANEKLLEKENEIARIEAQAEIDAQARVRAFAEARAAAQARAKAQAQAVAQVRARVQAEVLAHPSSPHLSDGKPESILRILFKQFF